MPTVRLVDPSALRQSANFDAVAGLGPPMKARADPHAAWFSEFNEHSDQETFVDGENRASVSDRYETLLYACRAPHDGPAATHLPWCPMIFSSHLPVSRRVTLNLEFLEHRHAPAIVGPLGTAILTLAPHAGFDASAAQFVPLGPAGRNDTAQQLAPVTNNEAAARAASAFSGGSLIDFVEQPFAPPTPHPVAPPVESLRPRVVTPEAAPPPADESPANVSQPAPSVPAIPAIHRPAPHRVEPATPTVEPSSAPQIRIDPPTPDLPPPHPSPALSTLGGVFVFGLAVPPRLGKPHPSKLSTAALPPRRDAVK